MCRICVDRADFWEKCREMKEKPRTLSSASGKFPQRERISLFFTASWFFFSFQLWSKPSGENLLESRNCDREKCGICRKNVFASALLLRLVCRRRWRGRWPWTLTREAGNEMKFFFLNDDSLPGNLEMKGCCFFNLCELSIILLTWTLQSCIACLEMSTKSNVILGFIAKAHHREPDPDLFTLMTFWTLQREIVKRCIVFCQRTGKKMIWFNSETNCILITL